MDAAGEILELVKDLEAALAIVKYNAASQLNLTLQKAEVEVELIATREARFGFKVEFAISVDTSTEREWSDIHKLTLTLNPKQGTGKLGAAETEALAAAILELAAVHKRLADPPSTEFEAGHLTLSVAFEKSTSGKLQVVAGGGKTSKSARRVSRTFRPSL